MRRPHLSSHLHRCVFHPSVPISQTDMRTCEAHSLTCLHMCVTYVPPPLPKQTCGHACDEAHPPLTCPHECLPRPLPSTNAEDVRPTPRRSPLPQPCRDVCVAHPSAQHRCGRVRPTPRRSHVDMCGPPHPSRLCPTEMWTCEAHPATQILDMCGPPL